MTYIYALTEPSNTDVIRYIGKSDDIKKRYSAHIHQQKHTHVSRWIYGLKKQSLKPQLEIIDIVPYSEWEFWEKHYISLYKSWGFYLTNHTFGGESGASELRKGKTYQEIFGDKSVEVLKKLSDAHKGINTGVYNATSKAVIVLDREFNILGEFVCARDVEKCFTDVTYKEVSLCCLHKHHSAKGKYFFFKEEYDRLNIDEIKDIVQPKKRKYTYFKEVICTNGEKSYIFDSIRSATIELGITEKGIRRVLDGGRKKYRGYSFNYSLNTNRLLTKHYINN